MDQQNQARIGFTINLFIDQIGAVFFITLIYVIIKYKNLHKYHCLKLIGIFMFCNLFSKFIIWLPYLVRVVPVVNIPMYLCCAWVLFFVATCFGQLPYLAIIAFDRAVSVYFPIWYNHKSGKKCYFFLLCMLGTLYPLYYAIITIKSIADSPFSPTNCTGNELFGHYQSFDYQFIYAAIGCYILMLAKLLINSKERKSYFDKQPLFKSITLILAIQVGGWLLIRLAYQYVPTIFFNNATENQLPLLYNALNCASSISVTVEFFAIYITSSEHRKALKKEFPRLYYYFPDKIFDKNVEVTKIEIIAQGVKSPAENANQQNN